MKPRRLPIFLVVDVDGPVSDWSNLVTSALGAIYNQLKQDPNALELVWLSVIRITNPPIQVFPLTALEECDRRDFAEISKMSSSGSLGHAFKLAAECIQTEARRRTALDKGDYSAIVLSIVGCADIRYLSEGAAALAATRPFMSSVCCFSEATGKAIENFADGTFCSRPDAQTIAEWVRASVKDFWMDYYEGELRSEEALTWRNQEFYRTAPLTDHAGLDARCAPPPTKVTPE